VKKLNSTRSMMLENAVFRAYQFHPEGAVDLPGEEGMMDLSTPSSRVMSKQIGGSKASEKSYLSIHFTRVGIVPFKLP
jgi:hypothetical protein